jgi:hypothetical protein
LHLRLTYFTRAFSPRDTELEQRMRAVSPRLTKQTTMWKGQTGFHVTHSLGLITYAATYGYLGIAAPTVLFGSYFLVAYGAVLLIAYLVTARLYFFAQALVGVALALACYLIGTGIAYAP